MADTQTEFNTAVAHHQQGDFAAAEPGYRRVLELVPHHLDALYLLGTLYLQQGRFEPAIELLAQVSRAQPEVAAAHNNLGIAYKAVGQWERAIGCFERAARADPQYGEALYNLGQLHEEQQNWQAAAEWFGRYCECVSEDVESLTRLGFALTQLDRLEEAAAVYEKVAQLQPEFTEVLANLSYIYERQGRLDEAVDAAERAIATDERCAEALNNLGVARRSQHRLQEAVAAFDRALAIRHDFPLAIFNLATTKMLAGDLAGGWDGFEARDAIMHRPPRAYPFPQWQGEPLAGKTLLVHADEGFGDTIQFARFLQPAQKACGGKVLLQCQPALCDLLRGTPGVESVIGDENLIPLADAHISLLSLPRLLKIDAANLPATVPYLSVAPRETPFDDLLDSAALNVGIVWQGNPRQPRDLVRSCPLEQFSPLLETKGVRWVSLQVGEQGGEQLAGFAQRDRIVDASGRLTDFSATAGMISRLDLVISVDTAVAHLAGALGANVWTLLCHTPDWRWGLAGEETPWYPTMRLFRQPAWDDWASVIREVAARLEQTVAAR